MITAKEANNLSNTYAYSKEHFLDRLSSAVEKHAKYGYKYLVLADFCNRFEGFEIEYLDNVRELGYEVIFDQVNNLLTLKW